MKPVDQALLDFVTIFRELDLPYAVMGGIAVRAHSIPRPTWDVDVTVQISRLDLPKLFAAVEARGYSVPESYVTGWVHEVASLPLVKFRLYSEGGGVDVDLFLAESPFQQELLRRSTVQETEVGAVSVVSPEDLILLKLFAGRERDLIDVADILFVQGALDANYLRHWASQLGVRDLLEVKLNDRPSERP
jgi:hypothetical protein